MEQLTGLLVMMIIAVAAIYQVNKRKEKEEKL